jgi:hypothetical protein
LNSKGAVPYYDIYLRTRAWGKDIVVPTATAAVATAGIATIHVAGVEAYRAHSFKIKLSNFWSLLGTQIMI